MASPDHVTIPLTSNPSPLDEDLDSDGLVQSEQVTSPSHPPNSSPLLARFAKYWRRVPAHWSVERDPSVALNQLITLFGFLALCIFIFSVPSLLTLVSPQAPTPPGSAPDLDEAASTISGRNGAVAADHPTCSELGVKVLRDMGGNAVDAMVATVLCQGVLAPFASGLGGGAFIMVYNATSGFTRFYDAREAAPAAAKMAMYQKNATTAKFGGLAVAVPGELRGVWQAHTDWGSLEWEKVVNEVVEVADNAKVGAFLEIKLRQMNETIMASEGLRKVFTKKILTSKGHKAAEAAASVELPGIRRNVLHTARGVVEALNDNNVVGDASDSDKHGVQISSDKEDLNASYTHELLKEGDKMVNSALIETLKKIAKKGADALYVDLAGHLSAEIHQAGGIVTEKDLQDYTVNVNYPINSTYHGFQVLGAPLPSAGGLSIAMALNMIRELQFRKLGRNGLSYKMAAETLKWVFGARMGLGDPRFVKDSDRQVIQMLSRREAIKRVYRIQDDRTFGPRHYSDRISTSRLEDGTSHISILDKNGSAVSVTSTLNLPFGAGLMSNSTGILFNDQMDAFTTSATRTNAFGLYPSNENQVEGGKRPISSMSPTILLRNGEVFMVVGGSGGPKAVSGVLQTILNVVDYGDQLGDAISAPRLHHQLVPNEVSLEGANGTTCEQEQMLLRPSGGNGATGTSGWRYWSSVCKALKEAGHKVTGPTVHGAVQAVVAPDVLLGIRMRNVGERGLIYAASDPRRIGKAAAY